MRALAPSTRINALPRSGIRALMELAVQTPDVIRLEVGDPDFRTPEHILEAAASAARDGWTHYTPSNGLPALRDLVAEKVRDRNGIRCTADEVVVSTGGAGGIAATLMTLLDPGDEALVPDPGWPNYLPMIGAVGGVPIGYPLDRAHGFEPDIEALEASIGPRTRVLVVNTPANPTGAVFERGTVETLVDVARRHGLWLLSDECYDELVFEGEHVSPAALAPEGVITVFSFSKVYAMTGWRVGYVVCPRELAPLVAKAQEATVSCVSTVSQKAAEAALARTQEPARRMAEAYARRRVAALAALDAAGLEYVRPRGAFYVMVSLAAGAESDAFARRLLVEWGVAVTPGSAFGPRGEGMVRVSLAAAEDAVVTGVERLGAAVAADEAAL